MRWATWKKAERKLRNDASRAKSKLSGSAAGSLLLQQHLDEELAKDLARLMQEPVDVGLTDQAQAKPSSRKSKSAPAEPSAQQLLAAAKSEVLAAEKEMKRGKSHLEKANAKLLRAESKAGQPYQLLDAVLAQKDAEGELLRAMLARKVAHLSVVHLECDAAIEEASYVHREWGAALLREKKANQCAEMWEKQAQEATALAKELHTRHAVV